jgi:hypothetical protein
MLKVGIYGVDAENNLVIPTLWAAIGGIRDAVDPSGDPGTDPELPIWAQLADRVEGIAKDVKDLQQTGGASPGGSVAYDEAQNLTEEQKAQARKNIGAQPAGDYAEKKDIPTVPTNVSAFTNDVGYLTQHQDLSAYAKKEEIPPKLPNPHALTINGKTYDGSSAVSIKVEGGSGGAQADWKAARFRCGYGHRGPCTGSDRWKGCPGKERHCNRWNRSGR